MASFLDPGSIQTNSDGELPDFDDALPNGMSVDLIPVSGIDPEARQFNHPNFGRAVRFKSGTVYHIEICNDRDETVACVVTVDGVKVQKRSLIIAKDSKRTIKGFTVNFMHRETKNEQGGTETVRERHYQDFVALRDDSEEKMTNQEEDKDIGKIAFAFYKTRSFARVGNHKSEQSSKPRTRKSGKARPGVLKTEHGAEINKSYSNYSSKSSNRIWCLDKKQNLGGMSITICDRDDAGFKHLVNAMLVSSTANSRNGNDDCDNTSESKEQKER